MKYLLVITLACLCCVSCKDDNKLNDLIIKSATLGWLAHESGWSLEKTTNFMTCVVKYPELIK